ncbi:MAG: TonB-dependent receptor [Alphaproteobacteria bacterium]
MSKQFSVFCRGTSLIALAVAAASVAPAAWAQAAKDAASDEIIVTGSHLAKSAFNSPTPVNVIGDERMKALANPSVADTLNQIPSFRAITSPSTGSFRVFGNIGARSMDLRGLGVTRTLVLVDGKRFVPSSDNGTVDLNAVPSSLVKRAEVVTGGASAAYGADAVSGVVNLILDTKYTGVKTDVNAGVSEQGDGQNYFASFTAGQDFMGGRGHVVFGAEGQKEEGIGPCKKRDFCNRHTNYIPNPGYVNATSTTPAHSTNGLPNTLVLNDVNFTYSVNGNIQSINTTTGLKGQQINQTQMAASLKNLGFSATGGLQPFQYGDNLNGTFFTGSGGLGSERDELWGFRSPLVTPTKHFSTLGHVDYDITSHIQASGELLFSTVTGYTYGGYPIFTPVINLKDGQNGLGNPYLDPAVRAQLLAADPTITSININVVKPEVGLGNAGTSYNNTYRGVFGLKGDLETHNIKWDTSYEYGETDGQVKVLGVRLKQFDGGNSASGGTDAVTPPSGYNGPVFFTPTGAPVICNSSVSTVTGLYDGDGCMPVNMIGPNSLTPAMLAKYFQTEWAKRIEKQNYASANLSGDLFNLPAGAVTGAIGAEWRKDETTGPVDPQTAAGLFLTPQVTLLAPVSTTVKEAYIETSIPILKDQPFAKNLTIDGAKRWTNYSTAGDASTWKAGLVYEPDDQVLTRFTQSSDIREPTAAELNPNATNTLLPLADPFGGGVHNINTVVGGNPNLKLETAVTKTAGFVLKPHFLPAFRFSADYYNIKVSGAIDSFTAATILPACATQNQLCDLIKWTGAPKASAVDTVFSNFQNLSRLHAEGVEVVANYSFAALGGNFDATFNGNYLMDLKSIGATGLVTRFDGVTGNLGSVSAIAGVPEYKLDGILTYSRDIWSITAHARYIPQGILDQSKIGPEDAGYNVNLLNSISTNRVDSAAYLDLAGTYSPTAAIFGGKVQIYGSINNVFDKSEPDQLRLVGNGLQFDPYGRAYRLGIRANW